MSKYQLFTFKRYAEQALMFPFVLMGRLLGLFAANIRSWRHPEPYKGKGILYKNEQIIRKAGKSGK